MYLTLDHAQAAAVSAAELTQRDWCVSGAPTVNGSQIYFIAPCNTLHGYGERALYDTMMYD